jgi:hypothetical protein
MSTPGIRLSHDFYWQLVRPLLGAGAGSLPHTAALIGSGSEVLGFDDAMSADHHWGPRVMLFLRPADHAARAAAIGQMLAEQLPYTFEGYPTSFTPPNPDDNGVQNLQLIAQGPVNHRVELLTLPAFFEAYVGHNLEAPLDAPGWLSIPQQKLRSLTAGAVFHDELGLDEIRARLAFYPHDIWLYLMAAGWARIGQEEHLMGRAGLVGDEIGSALLGARLVRDVMRHCFLMERAYPPYPKWFGTAFQQLRSAPALSPCLTAALHAQSWQAREAQFVQAYAHLGRMHNALHLTEPMPEQSRQFFGRPFQVMALHGFADRLLAKIADPALQSIARRPPIGNIDLVSDNTDLLENPEWGMALRKLYE